MKLFELESTVNLQTARSKSLRTTVPVEIVKALNLVDKDKIKWIVSITDNDFVINVEKQK